MSEDGRSRTLPFDPDEAIAHLRSRDAKLGALIERAGSFALKLHSWPSPFESLFEAILYQQLHGKADTKCRNRPAGLHDTGGHQFTARRALSLRQLKMEDDTFQVPLEGTFKLTNVLLEIAPDTNVATSRPPKCRTRKNRAYSKSASVGPACAPTGAIGNARDTLRVVRQRQVESHRDGPPAVRRGQRSRCDPGVAVTLRRPNTIFENYRKEAERLLLRSVVILGKPLSSPTREDCLRYQQFLADPQPAALWVAGCGRKHAQRRR